MCLLNWKNPGLKTVGEKSPTAQPWEKPILDFILASGEVSKARAILRRWNRENPDRFVPYEWVEEAVVSKLRGDILRNRSGAAFQEQIERYDQFIRFLPEDLIDLLFGNRYPT